MTNDSFTWGAHLLIWVFPLALVLTAAWLYLREGRREGDRR